MSPGSAAQRAGSDVPALRVALAGLTASLSSPHVQFMRYAEKHLAPLRDPEPGPATIEATLAWHEHSPGDRLAMYPELRDMERVDRDIYRSATGLAWFRVDELPQLHLRVGWDGERLRVRCDFFVYLSRNRYRNWFKRRLYRRWLAELRQRRFTTLLYYLIYYPAFWWLEHHRDLHPIHAGAVELPSGIVVFAGPSGVGKSTLVTGLAGNPSARLVSDTFLLHHGARIQAVPEPLLLDGWSQRWIGDAATDLSRLDHRYALSRDGFHWASDRVSKGGDARLLVFPQRGGSHYLRPLSATAARGQLSAGNLIVNDLRRYWAFASVLELLDPTPLVHRREEQIATLMRHVPAYELGITHSMTRDGIRDRILTLMDQTPVGTPTDPARPRRRGLSASRSA